MDSSTTSSLEQLLSNSQSNFNPLENILEPIMPMLQLFLVLTVILSVVIVVYFIVGTVQKQRQHAAIMRIDQNLQKLVDRQEIKDSPKPDAKQDHPVILAAEETNPV